MDTVSTLFLVSSPRKSFCPEKVKKKNHSKVIFNENQVIQTSCQKHLSMFWDFTLNFGEHLKYMVHKGKKLLGLLSKL